MEGSFEISESLCQIQSYWDTKPFAFTCTFFACAWHLHLSLCLHLCMCFHVLSPMPVHSPKPVPSPSPPPKSAIPAKGDLEMHQTSLSTSSQKSSSTPSTVPSTFSRDLRTCVSATITRGQLTMIKLPPAVWIADNTIKLTIGTKELSNPLLLRARPSESTLRTCQQLLNQASEDD